MTAPLRVVRPWPLVDHRATPGQLDAALATAGWPLWTERGDCPLVQVAVPPLGHAKARQLGVRIPKECLSLGPMQMADRVALIAELTEAVPALADIARAGLVHVEDAGHDTDLTFFLGLTLEG